MNLYSRHGGCTGPHRSPARVYPGQDIDGARAVCTHGWTWQWSEDAGVWWMIDTPAERWKQFGRDIIAEPLRSRRIIGEFILLVAALGLGLGVMLGLLIGYIIFT